MNNEFIEQLIIALKLFAKIEVIQIFDHYLEKNDNFSRVKCGAGYSIWIIYEK